jgi:hypothetical protein
MLGSLDGELYWDCAHAILALTSAPGFTIAGGTGRCWLEDTMLADTEDAATIITSPVRTIRGKPPNLVLLRYGEFAINQPTTSAAGTESIGQ